MSEIVLEAMLAYWLSWYVLPSGHEDGINPYVFPIAIRLTKGTCFGAYFLGSLLYRLDECVQNQLKPMGGIQLFLMQTLLSSNYFYGRSLKSWTSTNSIRGC